MTKQLFEVTRESNKTTTRVRAESRDDAALRGAIKLGIRGWGHKPTMVVRSSRDSSRYFTYYWMKECNANSNIYEPVIVSPA